MQGADLISDQQITAGRHTRYYPDSSCIRVEAGGFEVGSFCGLGQNLTVLQNHHDYNYPAIFGLRRHRYYLRGITIGNDVWVGANVTILGGVTIGDGAVVGAGAVVVNDVAPYTIAGGVPAKEIKKRFPGAVVRALLQLQWWKWDDERIRRNTEFFDTNLNEVPLDVALARIV